jgi:hypothetical protein
MRPDALAEVAQVCRAAGFCASLPVLERLDVGGVHQEVVDGAIAALQEADARPEGLWFSDGRDAGEVRVEPVRPPALLWVAGSGVWAHESGTGWREVSWEPGSWRRMVYRRAGTTEAAPAVQVEGHTFHQIAVEALPEQVDVLFPAESAAWPDGISGSSVGGMLAEQLEGDGPVVRRARALLMADAGNFAGAAAELDEATGLRKAPADLRYLLGLARSAAGDRAGAVRAWTDCVDKARRKGDWHVVAAKRRLEDS